MHHSSSLHVDTRRSLKPDVIVQPYLADVLSVLAMVMGKPELRESLKYRILGSQSDIGAWGHEYVRYVFWHV